MTTDPFKITIHMVASVDGMIAKSDNSVSWFETTDQYEKGVSLSQGEMAAFLDSVDCFVMGASTYLHALELSRDYGWPYGDVPTLVLTHRELPVERQNITFFSGELDALVNERLKPHYRNVWLVGGAMLTRDFLRLKLADEIRLSVLPIILGEGKPFFDHIGQEQPLHLKDIKAYTNGMVELHYEIRK